MYEVKQTDFLLETNITCHHLLHQLTHLPPADHLLIGLFFYVGFAAELTQLDIAL